jgi:hypothetical protein
MLPPWCAEPCSAEGRPAAWLPARKAAARLPHSKACGAASGVGGLTFDIAPCPFTFASCICGAVALY